MRSVPAGYHASLGPLQEAVDGRLAELDADDIVERIWSRDYTVWGRKPAEIADRLGWLTVAREMAPRVPELQAFAREVAAEGYSRALLLGMGGSSLAPEVFRSVLGVGPGALELDVLDTTDPAQILEVEGRVDLARTLFIVASKSGGTIETRSHFEYFWEKCPSGRQFVVITDAGSALEKLGRERGVRRIFLNQPDIGGRFSALSLFGLVPAALIGGDLNAILGDANEMAAACREPAAAQNPGAWIGTVMAVGALAGQDKLTLMLSGQSAPLGAWLEQLVAESTGKNGLGIIPVDGEAAGSPSSYGNDRLFVVAAGDPAGTIAAGHPAVWLPAEQRMNLGAEFFRWEFATAVAGHILGVNPFDQPNVQEAKDRTAAILAGESVPPGTPGLADLLATLRPGDYVALTAYLPRHGDNHARLQAARARLRERFGVATTLGYGPRFLHSTGQLHKGGPNGAVILQVVADDAVDVPVPGAPYTFGQLKAAQALGDLAALREHGRRVCRATLDEMAAI